MLFCGNYIYDNINSRKFRLTFANLNSQRLEQLCNEAEYTAEYYSSLLRYSIQNSGFKGEPLSFEIEIISEYPINKINAAKIKRWMFNSQNFKRLYDANTGADSSNEIIEGCVKRCYVDCVFINPSEIRKAGNLYGFRCTCILASPMAFQEPVSKTLTSFSKNVLINVISDYSGYTYPHLEIITANNLAKSTVTVKNITDNNRSMTIDSVPARTTLYIDSAVGSIIDSSNNSYYGQVVNQKLLRLLQGKNELRISGDIESLKISYSNARYLL